MDRLERAVVTRDYETVCDRLFTVQARKRAGGAECARQLRSDTDGVKKPSIEIQAIDVKGNRATVRVWTRAQGQARVSDELRMRRKGGRWLVEALG
ncbi:MAG TPA: hypothetical protein VK486_08175 [Thermoleophilaceae bacterium]|nr:hypothetical protein [Thermoleophilaceae bacterium]